MEHHRDEVVEVIRELSGLLLKAESLDAALARVAELAVRAVPGCSAASVTMLRDGRFSTPVATHDAARRTDDAQYEADNGPCVETARTGVIARVQDVGGDPRWPVFAEVARRCGFASCMSLPLGVDGVASGALNLYASKAGAFADVDEGTAALLAEQAGVACLSAERYWSTRNLAAQLEEALKTRDMIGQAKGILMAQRKITESEAFDLLRESSQHLNIKVRDLADHVARTGELPSL